MRHTHQRSFRIDNIYRTILLFDTKLNSGSLPAMSPLDELENLLDEHEELKKSYPGTKRRFTSQIIDVRGAFVSFNYCANLNFDNI